MLKMSGLAHGVVAFGVALLAERGSAVQALPVDARHDALELRVLDERGAPLARAKVRIAAAGGACSTHVSGTDGRVELDDLPAGSYELIARASGRCTLRESVELPRAPLELQLAPLALLAVEVRTASGESYVQAVERHENEAQRPTLESMFAIATAEAPPKMLPIGLEDDEREYGIGAWSAESGSDQRLGYLRVDAQTDYFVSLVVGEFVIVTQRVARDARLVSIELEPATVIAAGAGLRGRLIDTDGNPVADVEVSWASRRGENTFYVRTLDDTDYQLRRIDDSYYRFTPRSGIDGSFAFRGVMESAVTLHIDHSPHLLPELRLQPGVVLDLGDVVVGGPSNSDFHHPGLGSATAGFGGELEIHPNLPPNDWRPPVGYGALLVHIEGTSASHMHGWRITRVGPDGATTHAALETPFRIQGNAFWITPLAPGSYAVGTQQLMEASSECTRIAPFKITADATAEVALRMERSGSLVLEPAGRTSIGTRFRLRDEATRLVNRTGLIERDELVPLILPRGAWQLELDLPDGARRSESVVVGERSTHVALPR